MGWGQILTDEHVLRMVLGFNEILICAILDCVVGGFLGGYQLRGGRYPRGMLPGNSAMPAVQFVDCRNGLIKRSLGSRKTLGSLEAMRKASC